MTAAIIDGKAVAARTNEETAQAVAEFTDRTGTRPGLATILVGDDAASAVYVESKRRTSVRLGMADFHRHLPSTASRDDVARLLDELASDDAVSGILLQLPLPESLDTTGLVDLIPPSKDVDGLTTASAGLLARGLPGLRPCTPLGAVELLDSSEVTLSGSRVVVVGRSELVGRPLAQLLLQRDATVTTAHSRTQDLPAVTRDADVLVVAAGVPGLIGAEHVKKGAVVIDVGIHRTETGLAGDVRFDEVVGVASAITPVPGGVGPMTIAMLMRNTLTAAIMVSEPQQ
ncbi:bifunctional methylenetetrahydrofolate dehydrogenase/methenyltetrahydrofolate cyclohydrolase FolD [Herbiconiux ginsengi]|uniref:Bifunctional protein FolD n=1 Tax=Herbiconiux ginsengi TaxID=381665 RepID=A0A1H3LN32_9MICO|nr:bifunctional methylenetetrahydrofolate dehydrogenase/methenyltetrahydrofolate cyclohydrolase FolD [Herbiconiux ginsengi]SDY65842.1 methenyltetrahydrofolate cyclohydrolase /5,10-methylenetetrahydrofolate dehydrogenase (NADP+) [Herbiconiux ginsengi]